MCYSLLLGESPFSSDRQRQKSKSVLGTSSLQYAFSCQNWMSMKDKDAKDFIATLMTAQVEALNKENGLSSAGQLLQHHWLQETRKHMRKSSALDSSTAIKPAADLSKTSSSKFMSFKKRVPPSSSEQQQPAQQQQQQIEPAVEDELFCASRRGGIWPIFSPIKKMMPQHKRRTLNVGNILETYSSNAVAQNSHSHGVRDKRFVARQKMNKAKMKKRNSQIITSHTVAVPKQTRRKQEGDKNYLRWLSAHKNGVVQKHHKPKEEIQSEKLGKEESAFWQKPSPDGIEHFFAERRSSIGKGGTTTAMQAAHEFSKTA
jgi:hypothetical protein